MPESRLLNTILAFIFVCKWCKMLRNSTYSEYIFKYVVFITELPHQIYLGLSATLLEKW